MSLLTSDGLLAVHESNSEENMELNDEPSVSNLPDEDPDFAEDFDYETDNEDETIAQRKPVGADTAPTSKNVNSPYHLSSNLKGQSKLSSPLPSIWIERPARSHFNTEPELVLEQTTTLEGTLSVYALRLNKNMFKLL